MDETKKLFDDGSNIAYVFAYINCNTVTNLKNGSYSFFDDISLFEKFCIQHNYIKYIWVDGSPRNFYICFF